MFSIMKGCFRSYRRYECLLYGCCTLTILLLMWSSTHLSDDYQPLLVIQPKAGHFDRIKSMMPRLNYNTVQNEKMSTGKPRVIRVENVTRGSSRDGQNKTSKERIERARAVAAMRPLLSTPEMNSEKRVSIAKSKLFIIGKKTDFMVGDTVKIRIDLYSQDGMRRTQGGDVLKVRIFEDALGASATGHVLDHGNGSYTAVVRCLWSGTSTVCVYFTRSRETIKTLKTIMTKIPNTWATYAVYTNGEEGECQAIRKWTRGWGRTCNMTWRNGGMSWYCAGPTHSNVSCDDLKQFRHSRSGVPSGLAKMLNPSHSEMPPLYLTIKDYFAHKVGKPSKTPCIVYNRTNLWTLKSPVGYFYRNKWTLLHCTPSLLNTFSQCLQNKHLVMYGDSTVRQWFVELKKRFRCELNGNAWTVPKWTRDSTVYCPSNNLTIDLVFHSLPGNFDATKVKFNAISNHMMKYYNQKETIFLVGNQNHLHPYHLNVYRDRLAHIRRSVDVILRGDPHARILFKGGHSSGSMFNFENDYRRVLSEQFADISDKIIYLDHMDMTFAWHVAQVHPPDDFVTEMVQQMLAYIC